MYCYTKVYQMFWEIGHLETIIEICATEVLKDDLLILSLFWPNSNQTKTDTEEFYTHLEKVRNATNIIFVDDFNRTFQTNDKAKRLNVNVQIVIKC